MRTLDELGISPAPWRMSPTVGDVENTVTENFETHDNTICTCWGVMSEMTANARLIASAPMLYEALRKLVDIIELTDWNNKDYWPYTEKADAALAAASGESEEGETK